MFGYMLPMFGCMSPMFGQVGPANVWLRVDMWGYVRLCVPRFGYALGTAMCCYTGITVVLFELPCASFVQLGTRRGREQRGNIDLNNGAKR